MSEESSSATQSPTQEQAETPVDDKNVESSPAASTPTSPTDSTPNQSADKTDKPVPDKPPAAQQLAPLSKIELIFKPVGDAPILKQSKWAVPLSKTIGWVNGNIRKYLKMEPSESLFIYIRQSFAPSLDQTIENLYNCFGSGDGKLIVHYSKTQAWG